MTQQQQPHGSPRAGRFINSGNAAWFFLILEFLEDMMKDLAGAGSGPLGMILSVFSLIVGTIVTIILILMGGSLLGLFGGTIYVVYLAWNVLTSTWAAPILMIVMIGLGVTQYKFGFSLIHWKTLSYVCIALLVPVGFFIAYIGWGKFLLVIGIVLGILWLLYIGYRAINS